MSVIQYTRLGTGGELFLKTDHAYSAFTDESGRLFVRPTQGIVRIDSEGLIWVTAPVTVDVPDDPDSEARVG